MRSLRALAFGFAALALPAFPATPPSQMMANVYRFSEASSMLHVCRTSEAYRALSPEKASRVDELELRFANLVLSIARHYGDEGLITTYERTRERLASDAGLRLHAKNNYQTCGDGLMNQMESYVGENEKLIGEWLRREGMKAARK